MKENRPRVLLFDNDRSILAVFKALFERRGFLVDVADSEEQLVALLVRYKPEFLVTDWQLDADFTFGDLFPSVEIPLRGQETAIVVHTGCGHLEEVRLFCEREGCALAPKPIAIELMVEQLQVAKELRAARAK